MAVPNGALPDSTGNVCRGFMVMTIVDLWPRCGGREMAPA